jgi:hypothetical protein
LASTRHFRVVRPDRASGLLRLALFAFGHATFVWNDRYEHVARLCVGMLREIALIG